MIRNRPIGETLFFKMSIVLTFAAVLGNLLAMALLWNGGENYNPYRLSVTLFSIVAMCGVFHHMIGIITFFINDNSHKMSVCIICSCVHIMYLWVAFSMQSKLGTLYTSDFIGALIALTWLSFCFFHTPDLILESNKVKK